MITRFAVPTVLTAVLSMGIAFSATAAPIQWTSGGGGNDHYYDFVRFDGAVLTWQQAQSAALGLTFAGRAGYLVTITSGAENEFIRTNFGNQNASNFAWFGGTDEALEGTWVWADGPEAGRQFSLGAAATAPDNYVNWQGAEPSNTAPDNYTMYNLGKTFASVTQGGWADAAATPSGADPVVGSLVEFSELQSVPEPSSLTLLGVGALFLLASAGRQGPRSRDFLS